MSTDPYVKKKVEFLRQTNVLEEALSIYRERTSRNGIEGFFEISRWFRDGGFAVTLKQTECLIDEVVNFTKESSNRYAI